jgi:hypothetical protein
MITAQRFQHMRFAYGVAERAHATEGQVRDPGIAALHIGVFAKRYSSPEIRMRVVTPTGEPVADAIVVATWSITGYFNAAPLGQLDIRETVTDKNGEFRIPAWGPLPVSTGTIMGDEPHIRIFHPHFLPRVLTNSEGVPMKLAENTIEFRLQDQAITLYPFHGTPSQFSMAMEVLDHSLEFVFSDPVKPEYGRCYVEKMPRMLIAIQRVKDELEREGVGENLHSLGAYAKAALPQCGDPKLLFQGYIK